MISEDMNQSAAADLEGSRRHHTCSAKLLSASIKQEPLESDNWEMISENMHQSSAVDREGSQDHTCSAKLLGIKQEPQESVEQAFSLDPAMSNAEDDDQLAQFAALFDSQPEVSANDQGSAANVEKNMAQDLHCAPVGNSPESSDDDDDDWTGASCQPLCSNAGACKLKVEGIDDVTDFISEFVREPAAEPGETACNLKNNMVMQYAFVNYCKFFDKSTLSFYYMASIKLSNVH